MEWMRVSVMDVVVVVVVQRRRRMSVIICVMMIEILKLETEKVKTFRSRVRLESVTT